MGECLRPSRAAQNRFAECGAHRQQRNPQSIQVKGGKRLNPEWKRRRVFLWRIGVEKDPRKLAVYLQGTGYALKPSGGRRTKLRDFACFRQADGGGRTQQRNETSG